MTPHEARGGSFRRPRRNPRWARGNPAKTIPQGGFPRGEGPPFPHPPARGQKPSRSQNPWAHRRCSPPSPVDPGVWPKTHHAPGLLARSHRGGPRRCPNRVRRLPPSGASLAINSPKGGLTASRGRTGHFLGSFGGNGNQTWAAHGPPADILGLWGDSGVFLVETLKKPLVLVLFFPNRHASPSSPPFAFAIPADHFNF
ncbi:MAG: hypothetical protein CM15mP39_11910 [Synechococcus sp.]|nr:MAG: hypothetical protein CM15mP39_11910 [Synechococcus sp.]